MILVDTSVWVHHLRQGDRALAAALELGRVLMHPFIVGELSCGNPKRRAQVLSHLRQLPRVIVATDEEALGFIEKRTLMDRGIGLRRRSPPDGGGPDGRGAAMDPRPASLPSGLGRLTGFCEASMSGMTRGRLHEPQRAHVRSDWSPARALVVIG
jgi:predicted nucleic acid-binding protein